MRKPRLTYKCRPEDKQLHFHFFQTPTVITGGCLGTVASVMLSSSQHANGGQGRDTEFPAQLVLKSIGYKAKPLAGVAFEDGKGIIPNRYAVITRSAGCHMMKLTSFAAQTLFGPSFAGTVAC